MDYLFYIATLVSIAVIFVLSLNLVLGYTGLPLVAHATFSGIGAYTMAILLRATDLPYMIAVLLGIVVTMIAGLLIGLVLSKFREDYFVLASIGFAYIGYNVALNWQGLTRGPLGIPGIPHPEIFGYTFTAGWPFFLYSLVGSILAYVLCRFIVRSSFGRVLQAIREDEQAIAVFGYKVQLYKLTILVIACGLAALSGMMWISHVGFISPIFMDVMKSVDVLVFVIIGGLASLRGSVLGAFIFILIPEMLRFVGVPDEIAGNARQALFGLALVALMLYRPQGILGKFRL